MPRNLLGRYLLLGVLFAAPAALARKPQEFHAPTPKTQAEIEAAKERARNGGLSTYGRVVEAKPQPFPWMMVGICCIAFVAAAPLAFRLYRRTTHELEGMNTFGSSGRARAPDSE